GIDPPVWVSWASIADTSLLRGEQGRAAAKPAFWNGEWTLIRRCATVCATHAGGLRMWPDRRLLDLFNIELPIVLAPMAGAMDVELAAAVAQAGALASLLCAMLDPGKARGQLAAFRARSEAKLNLNFFCHVPPELNNAREARWRERLAPYYAELGID